MDIEREKKGRHEIDQLKNDEKKAVQERSALIQTKQPGPGTQEPVNKTARDWDPRTHEEKSSANSRRTNPNLIGWCKRQRVADMRTRPTSRRTSGTSESSASATSEWSEKSVSSVGSWTRSFSTMKRWFALQTENEIRRDQRLERFHDLIEDAVRDFEQDDPSDREKSLPLSSKD